MDQMKIRTKLEIDYDSPIECKIDWNNKFLYDASGNLFLNLDKT